MHDRIRMVALLTALFALSSFAQSADNEPLHGSWISQSESDGEGEVTVTFYPDGTYRMITRGPTSGSFLEDGDGSEEEGDGSEEDGWEDLLAELDSNDNGVIDEEDFEAARERGDEDLPPSWDHALQEIGDANGDGVIDQEEFEGGRNPSADWQGEAGVEFSGGLFGEEMIITMVMTGTWEAADGQFTLVPIELVLEINDMTLVEFYSLFLGSLFESLFQESGLSEEEFLSMIVEDNPDSIDAPESLEEYTAAQVESFAAEITAEMATDLLEVETFVYSIDGDEMTATDSVGEPLGFVRVDAGSAVEAYSWGQVKALYR